MTKLNSIALALASCLALGGLAGQASAQDRDWDRDGRRDREDRGWRDRDRDDRGFGRRDWDDDWDRDGRRSERGWRGRYDRDRHCFFVRRRFVEPDGDVVFRRYRVCED